MKEARCHNLLFRKPQASLPFFFQYHFSMQHHLIQKLSRNPQTELGAWPGLYRAAGRGAPCRTRGPFPAGLTAEGTHLGSCPSCISLTLSLASIWGYPFLGVLRLLVPLQRGCYSMDNAHCSAQSPVLHRASCWMQHPAPAPPLQRKCPELSLVNGNNVGFGSNTGFASNSHAYHYVLIEPD